MQVKITLTVPPNMYETLLAMAAERDMGFDALCSELVMVGAVDLRKRAPRVEDHIDRGGSSLAVEHSVVRPSRRGGL